MEEIEAHLDSSPEAEDVRLAMRQWNQKFELGGDPRGFIEDFSDLIKAIQGIAYKAVRSSSVNSSGQLNTSD
jgi:hypothetical protein